MTENLTMLFTAFFLTVCAFGQNREWYLLEHNGGLCSSSIVLFKDGTYNCESGCEASSYFSFGNWTQKKDTILFKQADRKNFTVIKSIQAKKSTDSTQLTVKLFDQNGNNISDRIRVGQYVQGAGTYPMDVDSSKEKQTVYRRNNGIIVLTTLQELFKQRLAITVGSSDYFEITLNIPSDWIYHPNSKWDNIGDFKKIKSRKGLISVDFDNVENGQLIKTVYPLEKE